jgi:DNA primase
MFALCPFHDERTPSCKVDDEKGFFYCFGCGAHGDAIDFVRKTEHLSFPAAVVKVASLAGIDIGRSYKPSSKELAERARRLEANKQEQQAERQERWGEAAVEAQKVWDGAEPIAGTVSTDVRHGYLQAKGVASFGLRVWSAAGGQDELLIPLFDVEGKLWNVQRIYLDKWKYEKRFSRIARPRAAFTL